MATRGIHYRVRHLRPLRPSPTELSTEQRPQHLLGHLDEPGVDRTESLRDHRRVGRPIVSQMRPTTFRIR